VIAQWTLFRIKSGIDIDAVNRNGCTALHLAAGKDRLDTARVLIEYGACKDILNENNETSVDLGLSTPMQVLLQSNSLLNTNCFLFFSSVPLFQSSARHQVMQV